MTCDVNSALEVQTQMFLSNVADISSWKQTPPPEKGRSFVRRKGDTVLIKDPSVTRADRKCDEIVKVDQRLAIAQVRRTFIFLSIFSRLHFNALVNTPRPKKRNRSAKVVQRPVVFN